MADITNTLKVPANANAESTVKNTASGMTKEQIASVPTAPGTLQDGKDALTVTFTKNKGNKSGAAFSGSGD